jgi:uncharacterized protein (PEP-CTERM system associated)
VQSRFCYKIKRCRILALLPLCSIPAVSIAGDIEIDASVAATSYVYETKEEESEAKSNHAVVVIPSILASYSSRRLLTSFAAEHTTVEQKNDVEGADKNFTDYKYNSSLVLIRNTLNIAMSGQQGYRVIDTQQEFIADRVLAAGDLSQYSNHLGSIEFTIPNPKYFGINIQSSYSETKTDGSINGSVGLNSDNTATSIQLYQGKNARNYTFNFATQYNDTSRASLEDFKSSLIQGSVGVSIFQDMSFVLTGNREDYDINQDNFSRRTNLDSTTYGAGILWQPRSERSLRLTYNQLEEGENETKFVGVNLDWAFSSRTALKFDYGKRFYGDAFGLNFSHALKSIRSSVSYIEEVTSFGRLETTTGPIGLFVCQFGSIDLTDCFLPESTTYQLQAGEEFRALAEIGSDISEEVIFRKSGSFNLSYQKRRVKASITASYGRVEYLESDRVQTNRNIRFNVSYALGRKTNINFSTTVARNSFDSTASADKVINTNLNFDRTLGRNLQLNTGIGIVNRDSDVAGRNLEDKRLTIGINYTF